MAEPLVTIEEFMAKYADLKLELVNGRVTLSGKPIQFVDGRIECHRERLGPGSGVVLKTAPQLCVEVRSPSNTWSDIFGKVGDYLSAGVTTIVVLDPDTQTASVYRDNGQQIFTAADTLTLPDVLPGFSVPVARFFA